MEIHPTSEVQSGKSDPVLLFQMLIKLRFYAN
jgi:hypothetical protein